MNISKDIFYIGVNDHQIDLFEGQYIVPNGMAYNSYVIVDEKIAVMDTVDARFTQEWLDNLQAVLGDRKPDYLIVQHMEPDHSANIDQFMKAYPEATVVATSKAFQMMEQFFGTAYENRRIVVKDNDTLSLGSHQLTFIAAPMVHWPEVIMTYDSADKVLFSADAFGKFGANDIEEEWACEARRYYIGIVGKYGAQVQKVLSRLQTVEVSTICPLHGPVLSENLNEYIDLYDTWSSYAVETEGVVIAYTSVYGNTKKAVELLADKLKANGCPKVSLVDLARSDMAEAVEDAFRYDTLVLATTTYNNDIFPFMRSFIEHLTERNFQSRQVAFVENGSWAPNAAKIMREMLEGGKNLCFAQNVVTVKSALSDSSRAQISALADELWPRQKGKVLPQNDPTALFSIGYGLYVVTSNDGKKDNGLIVNTVTQVTNTPNRVAVTINKQNYSHHVILKTGKMNVNCLTTEAPFKVFETFGFQSGRTVNKFADCTPNRSANGLVVLPRYINAFFSLEVEQYVDVGTHGMFICRVTEAEVVSKKESMTYTYYHNNVKPKPKTDNKKGYVCKICGYVYEGEELPADFICPWCKHGAADFEPIQ